MDINKVLTMAKNLKNHFRVFEELEEFMREAVALQSVVKEFESRKAGLQEEIEALGREKVLAGEATRKFKDQKRKEADVLMQTLHREQRRSEDEISLAISKAEAGKKKAEEELTEMEVIHAETRQRMEEETRAAEATLAAVEKKIRDIKAKLE